MIKITNLQVPEEYGNRVWEYIASSFKIHSFREKVILKKSVDARKRSNVHYVFTVAFSCDNEKDILRTARNAEYYSEKPKYRFPYNNIQSDETVVVVGMGPAGLFAALALTDAGVKCLLVDRGENVEKRAKDVESFWHCGDLKENSNVQFGEGGAGTFSDGKLTTGISDERIRFVLDRFIEFGAPEDIGYLAKPHIGTDMLKTVVKNIRKYLISQGCEVRFNTILSDIDIQNGKVTGCKLGDEYVKTSNIILAIGNSARDTFEMLLAKKVSVTCKSFAAGVRIEHLQEDIDMAQYGKSSRLFGLPAPDYKLAVHLNNERTVYTFCVCPGGYVVAAASEKGRVVTNGMSEYARDNVNINGALLVSLTPEDFDNDPKKAIGFQRKLESLAYEMGGENYCAPAQTVGDFLNGKSGNSSRTVIPSYRPGIVWKDLHDVLPEFMTEKLEKAIPEMGKKVKGFDSEEAVLTAVETRSSSPVRIDRLNFESVSAAGLFPCGEGAGYAGGIMSAAVDGIKCAEALCGKLDTKKQPLK